jgi:predicted DCC family thiol-disulfide oxidoreductase YuxK
VSAATLHPVVRFAFGGAERPDARLDREHVVLYDGDCRVCTRLAGVLRRWDHDERLGVLPSSSPGVHDRFPSITAQDYARALQLVRRDGARWQGAAAIEQLLRVLPKGRLVSWVFSIPGVRAIARRLYAWFARNRYRLGCGAHCSYRASAGGATG